MNAGWPCFERDEQWEYPWVLNLIADVEQTYVATWEGVREPPVPLGGPQNKAVGRAFSYSDAGLITMGTLVMP